jgi:hypothetical protein
MYGIFVCSMATVTGGEKMRAALKEIAARISKNKGVKVGFLQGSTAPDGMPMALRAAIHNYGAPRAGIPPRPFMTNAVVKYAPGWPGIIVKLLRANDYDVAVTLDLLGLKIKEQIQQSIDDTNTPPLKPATIARKGFAKPLIEYGDMKRSVDYKVL